MNFLGMLANLYFRNIKVIGNPNFDSTLIVSNHRNGAVDGFVLSHVFGKKTKFIVGKNLVKSWFMRLFFGGQIEVYRKSENDEQAQHNKKQLKQAAQYIQEGMPVIMFPEGTSHLNPGFLPIKKGAALLVHSLGGKKIVPIGLHYERGWSFRSDVIVRIGEPVEVEGRNLTDKTESIRKHLENVYRDDEPFPASKQNPLLAMILTPLIAAFMMMNFIAMGVPFFIGKKFADDRNVICLWRLLSGTPAFLLQVFLWSAFALFNTWILPTYFVVTVLGLLSYRRWKDAASIQ